MHHALATEGDAGFTETLKAYGFILYKSFVQDYMREFGESPSETFRRNPNAAEINAWTDEAGSTFCEHSINQFIDVMMRKSISLSDLARRLGKTEQDTITVLQASVLYSADALCHSTKT